MNLNMSLPYARVTVSIRDATAHRISASCLNQKNDVAHGLSISKNTQ